MEYDDLNSKSREADKDVNAMQLKIQEVNNNLAKLNKDKDCKLCYTFRKFILKENDTVITYFAFRTQFCWTTEIFETTN